jgi:hypothetical protein
LGKWEKLEDLTSAYTMPFPSRAVTRVLNKAAGESPGDKVLKKTKCSPTGRDGPVSVFNHFRGLRETPHHLHSHLHPSLDTMKKA